MSVPHDLRSSLRSRPPAPPNGRCPSCRVDDLVTLVSLDGPVHTSVLLGTRGDALAYGRGPIELALCGACGLITNTAFDAPGHDYSASYEETQAHSPRFREYARTLVQTLVSRHELVGRDVLEIGCGRGDMLVLLAEATGARAFGVDPSWRGERFDDSIADRVEVTPEFLAAHHLDREFGLVLCRHTLEHVHDVRSFLDLLYSGLAHRPETPVVFEVPDTGRVLRETAFWDVYYEHCSYFTPGSLARCFRVAGFTPVGLDLGFDDQYVLLTAVAAGMAEAPSSTLEESVEETRASAERFVARLEETREVWQRRLTASRARGETCVLWGAGSKGVGFLATIGLSEEILCVVDVNPAKFGMFMPGSGHEIVPPDRLVDIRPDLVVIMNPVYEAEIRSTLVQLGVDADVLTL